MVHGIDDAAGFNAALAQLFDTYHEDGAIEFRYRTVALAFILTTQSRDTRLRREA